MPPIASVWGTLDRYRAIGSSVPPSHEKEQTTTREAMQELAEYLRLYQTSKYTGQAKDLYRQCLRRLVSHELYVARFYLEQDRPKATIMRLEGIVSRFPAAGVDAEVLLLLGRVYLGSVL
jgi:outer membrane protein assembly factor BamD (BamD/ComL family)